MSGEEQKSKRRLGSAEQPPFLGMDPPPWAARGLATVLIALFVVAFLVSILVKVPETVTSTFVLAPVHGTDPVRALWRGVVSSVNVVEGQAVRQGQTLFVVRSYDVGDRASQLHTLEAQRTGTESSMHNAENQYQSDRRADEQDLDKYRQQVDNLDRMIRLQRERSSLAQGVADRVKRLKDLGLESWVSYSNAQQTAKQAEVDLEQLVSDRKNSQEDLEKLRHQMTAKKAQFDEQERTFHETLQTTTIQIDSLKHDLGSSAHGDLEVPAPCSGTVLTVEAKRSGAIVEEGDPLCQLACSGQELQARMTVPQSGFGKVRVGQGVKLLYDAFPYERYGVQYGTVRWTSPASVSEGNDNAFLALVGLERQTVRAGGADRPLLPGMTGTAQIVVERRSIIDFAFEPLRALKENLSGGPQSSTAKSKR
ncbi:MAG TPA: HlyD family efflux transporter periplasmic adaptor subunit [Thermoanaerobaculia bacterium]|nr:HlyD family efflux transporter periplasmic adaptor subunit [Thermoanaerobaculia bacterium]